MIGIRIEPFDFTDPKNPLNHFDTQWHKLA